MSARRTTRIWADDEGGYAAPLAAALLSLATGVVVAAILLVLQPVARVKALPKPAERGHGTVYLVEGNRDAGRLQTAPEKIQFLLRGQLVTFSEEDINALLEAAFAVRAKKSSDGWATPGTPNVRIHEGVIQIAVEVKVECLGQKMRVQLQARGTLRERAEGWFFEPAEVTLGALPLERIPFAAGWVTANFLDPRRLHPDLATAWNRLGRVVVEGNLVKAALR